MKKPRIRVLALCVFRQKDRILVSCLNDPAKGEAFYRPLGGGVKFGESAAEAMQREIQEELYTPVKGLKLLGVLENRFTYNGRPGHEIVFVYDGVFENEKLYAMENVPAREGDERPIRTKWIDPYCEGLKKPLYPQGLRELLLDCRQKGE